MTVATQPVRRLFPWSTPRRRMHLCAGIMAAGGIAAVIASWSATDTPMAPYGYAGVALLLGGLFGAGISWVQVWARWLKAQRDRPLIEETSTIG